MIKKILKHIVNGTLVESIRNRENVRKHKKWDEILKSGREFFDMPLSTGTFLRLPLSFGSSKKIYLYDAEKEEVEFVCSSLKKGDVFLDIGAHIGYFSVAVSPIVGNIGQVHSFEPTPGTFSKLKANIEANKLSNVKLNNLGLSNEKTTLQIHHNSKNEAFNSIAKGDEFFDMSTEIECVQLDDYWKNQMNSSQVDFIKIDVEGWEVFVFEGAREMLSAPNRPAILLEFSQANQTRAGKSCSELYYLLKSYGYEFFELDGGLKPFSFVPEFNGSINILAR